MITIREKTYLYAAVPGAYHTPFYALPGKSTMGPAEACRSLGLKKAIMDVTLQGPFYPFDPVSESLSFLDELVWTIIPSGGVHRNEDAWFDMEEVIRQIQRFPNVGGVFCDDFLVRRRKLCSPEKLMELGRQVKASTTRKIEQWLVVYNYDLFTDGGFDHQVWEYTNIPDVITFWTWQSFHLKVLREHLSYVRAKCPGKKLNLGVYLWDFSTGKPLTDEWMKLQLDATLAEFRAGVLDSISLCASCLMGLGIKAENDFRRWLDKYGDEEVPNQVILPAENAVNNDQV